MSGTPPGREVTGSSRTPLQLDVVAPMRRHAVSGEAATGLDHGWRRDGADGYGARRANHSGGTDRCCGACQGGPALQEEAPMQKAVSRYRFAQFFAKAALFRHRALPGSVSHLDSTALLARIIRARYAGHEQSVGTA